MANRIKSRRSTAAAKKASVESRDLLLAGIGAVSLTRKQGIKLYSALLKEGKMMQGKVEQVIEDLQSQIKVGAELVRGQVDAIVTPLRSRFDAAFGTAKAEIESRLAPMLDKLGVKRAVKTRVRGGTKRVVRKTRSTAKRAVRKTKAA